MHLRIRLDPLLPFLLLASTAASAATDSFRCDLRRDGEAGALSVASEFQDGLANAKTTAPNELFLGLDANLSAQSFFVVVQDEAKQQRVAFSASPSAALGAGALVGTANGGARCRLEAAQPSKAMPAKPELPEYFVCVVDELTYARGSLVDTKRVLGTSRSTALFRLPTEMGAENARLGFRVKLNRMDFQRGLEVTLVNKESKAEARFSGPAGTLHAAFLLGLTEGDRAVSAKFLRLGCIYANAADVFKDK